MKSTELRRRKLERGRDKKTEIKPESSRAGKRALFAAALVAAALEGLHLMSKPTVPEQANTQPEQTEMGEPSGVAPQELAGIRNSLRAAAYLLGRGALDSFSEASAQDKLVTEIMNTNIDDIDLETIIENNTERRTDEGHEGNIIANAEGVYQATPQQALDEYFDIAENIVVEQDRNSAYVYLPGEDGFDAVFYLGSEEKNGVTYPALQSTSAGIDAPYNGKISIPIGDDYGTVEQRVNQAFGSAVGELVYTAWEEQMEAKYGMVEE